MGTIGRKRRFTFGLALAAIILLSTACSAREENSPASITERPEQGSTPETLAAEPDQEVLSTTQGEAWFEGACNRSQYNSLTNLQVYPVPSMDEPARGTPFLDPVFGTCLVRVTDRTSDLGAGDTSQGIKNEYSRVQSFNADGSRLIAYTTDGNWYLYDAMTLQPLGQIPVWHEPRWDAVDPDLIYYTEDTRLLSYRLSNGQQQVVHEFAEDLPDQSLAAVWTRYEGSPSIDGRYWGLMAEDQDWMTVAMLIYDLETDQVFALRETPPSEIDSVTISPLGEYFLAFYDDYCDPGQLGSNDEPCGLMVYDQNLENGRGLLRIVGHSDLALDAQGEEVLVYQDIDTDSISMLDLRSGEITPLLPIDFSHSALGFHFSGRAFLRPGWILVSTSNGTLPSSTWMDDQVFAVEIVQGGRVVRLAHTLSVIDQNMEHDYWAEPHASVNQDFTRVVFTSNWGRAGTDQVDMYMINILDNWVSTLP